MSTNHLPVGLNSKAAAELAALRARVAELEKNLHFIKFLVTGDKIPRWQNDIATTITRETIANACDEGLKAGPA